MEDPQIVRVEPRLAAIVRKDVPLAQIPQAQRDARRLLETALATAGIDERGATLTVWRPPTDGTVDYAPGLFVTDRFEAPAEVTFMPLPDGRAAHLVLRGGFDQLPNAWQRLFAACDANGWACAGLNWEVYPPLGTAASAAETKLYALLS